MSRKQLTIAELKKYPPEAAQLVLPQPTTEGKAKVGAKRGRAFDLHYKTYGHGPNRIVWISGHASGLEDWYEIVKIFGGENGTDYTSLIFENRGIGESGAPWSLCSMKDLANDTKDLLDHVGWTEDKSVTVVGHSMGGMIALQLAVLYPNIISSLILISTTSNFMRTSRRTMKTIFSIFTLLTADSRLNAMKSLIFGPTWLYEPDPKGVFPTKGDAWAARFLKFPVHHRAIILQSPPVVWHRIEADDLRIVTEKVGDGRVGVVHGLCDQNLPCTAGQKLYEELGGGSGEDGKVKSLWLDDTGHMPHVERFDDLVKFIRSIVDNGIGKGQGIVKDVDVDQGITSQ